MKYLQIKKEKVKFIQKVKRTYDFATLNSLNLTTKLNINS